MQGVGYHSARCPSSSQRRGELRLDDQRLHRANWRLWGPYLAERVGHRARGLQRERRRLGDLPHDPARSRAYRSNEDGLGGICDESQRLCFSLALWNGRDPILKERPFGLTGREGNHGEDVKGITSTSMRRPATRGCAVSTSIRSPNSPIADCSMKTPRTALLRPSPSPSLAGVRNWDYRYCWLRDATFTLLAMMNAGYIAEARAWRDWLLRAVAGDPRAPRSSTAWAESDVFPNTSSIGSAGMRAHGRCGSATPRTNSFSSTSTAR